MARHHDPAAPKRSEAGELMETLRLVGIAAVSALVTATLVIGIGGSWIERSAQAAPPASVAQFQTGR